MDVSYLGEGDTRDLNSVLHLVQAGAEVATEEESEECCAKSPRRQSLPEDILFDILMRVPARRLISLKRVCKLWKSIIQNPEFTRAHLKYWKSISIPEFIGMFPYTDNRDISPSQYDHLISSCFGVSSCQQDHHNSNCLCFGLASLDIETMTYHRLKENMNILDYVDGLILFSVENKKDIYVCNPLTQRLIKLELGTDFPRPDDRYSYPYYKLVFDSVLRKYKLVVFCERNLPPGDYGNCYCVLILNGSGRMENPVWRKIETTLSIAWGPAPVVTRGNLYFMVYPAGKVYIQSFDIVKEEFNNMIQLPCQPPIFAGDDFDDDMETHFGLIQMETPGEGSLLVAISRPIYEIGIWVLEDWDKHYWKKLYTFDNQYNFCVLFVMNSQNFEDEMKFIVQDDETLHSYNYSLKSRVMTKIGEHQPVVYFPTIPTVLLTPSLVSWD